MRTLTNAPPNNTSEMVRLVFPCMKLHVNNQSITAPSGQTVCEHNHFYLCLFELFFSDVLKIGQRVVLVRMF